MVWSMENLASKPADQLIMVPNCGRVSINPTALVTIKNNYAAKKIKNSIISNEPINSFNNNFWHATIQINKASRDSYIRMKYLAVD